MASAAHVNTLQDYIIRAMPVLAKIPGFFKIVNADEKRYDVIAGAYPDAAFAAMIINNLFHHDREFSEIHQQAFSSIVDGATIPSVPSSKVPATNRLPEYRNPYKASSPRPETNPAKGNGSIWTL